GIELYHVGRVLEVAEEERQPGVVVPLGLGRDDEIVLAHAAERELVAAEAEAPEIPASDAEGAEGKVAVRAYEVDGDARVVGHRELRDGEVDRVVVAPQRGLDVAVRSASRPGLDRQGEEGGALLVA